MGTTKLVERFAYSGGAVDRSGARPVVRGVLLCGPTSANRRRYAKEAFAAGRVQKYDGKPVYVGHAAGERTYSELLGRIRNPRLRADGMPVGDLEVDPLQQDAARFLRDAETEPTAIGLSHVAHCHTVRAADGWEDVRALEDVESVDVVLNPATTKSLYESTKRGRPMPTTLRAVIEAVRPKLTGRHAKAARKALLLAEDDGPMGAMMDVAVDEPAADADPGAALDQAFLDAITAELQECMAAKGDPAKLKSCLGKVKKMLNAHAEIVATDDPGLDADAEPDGDEGEPPMESRRKGKRPALGAVLAECQAKGYTATGADLVILTELASAESRAAYIDRLAGVKPAGTAPTGVSRRPAAGSAGRVTEQQRPAPAAAPVIPKFSDL